MTVCLPFSKIKFLTVNPRTGYILLGFIMLIIIYCYYDFYYLNDIGTGLVVHLMNSGTGVLSFVTKQAISFICYPFPLLFCHLSGTLFQS